jgi:hypothetical protein
MVDHNHIVVVVVVAVENHVGSRVVVVVENFVDNTMVAVVAGNFSDIEVVDIAVVAAVVEESPVGNRMMAAVAVQEVSTSELWEPDVVQLHLVDMNSQL